MNNLLANIFGSDTSDRLASSVPGPLLWIRDNPSSFICDLVEHVQCIVFYVYVCTLVAIALDRYRYIKYENENIIARYSVSFINLSIWGVCTILVCVQKKISKVMNVIAVNPVICKHIVPVSANNTDINYGLITVIDMLPLIVVLCILIFSYSILGTLLYYLKIYSVRRWKRLMKKMREIDNIMHMSMKVIHRKPHTEDEKTKKKKNGRSNEKIEDIENECTNENNQTKQHENGELNDKSLELTHMTQVHKEERDVKRSQREDSFDNGDNTTNDFTKSTETIKNSRSSMCEPLNLYKDDHAQSMKMLLKGHKVIVNVSEVDDRVVIQTISQQISNNSDFNLLEANGLSTTELEDPNENNGEEIVELTEEDIHLIQEQQELNMTFIMMLFFSAIVFLILWLPMEIYNLSDLLAEKILPCESDSSKSECSNGNHFRNYSTFNQIYANNSMNKVTLLKSSNVIVLFVFFYCMYDHFRTTFNDSVSRIRRIVWKRRK
uniref:G-protein coupled receptors family 1 profile domain-containing protein n=1 Tax=Cacopsylla melanoneura TaxID=428564 RepID=A0A8D8QY30_9HEMI